MNQHEYSMALMTLILLVAAVGIFSSGTTGSVVRGTFSGMDRTTREVPVLNYALNAGYEMAPESARVCTKTMKYQGRLYSKYLLCCKAECLPKCKEDPNILGNDIEDCMVGCEFTCEDIMTRKYLSRKPGEWR